MAASFFDHDGAGGNQKGAKHRRQGGRFDLAARPHHDNHADKTNRRRRPAAQAYNLAQKQHRQRYEKQRAGIADGDRVGQRQMRNGIKAAQHGKGAAQAAEQMQSEPLGPHQAETKAEEERQHHEQPEQGAEKCQLKGIERPAQKFDHRRHAREQDAAKDDPQRPAGVVGQTPNAATHVSVQFHRGHLSAPPKSS
ncbi:MAG: hypothetical protein VCD66_10450 [Alphaproteobacteria bacterium]